MRALVTGGTGFVGSHLVDRLLAQGYEVRCIVRPTSNLQWLVDPRIELFFSGLLEPEKLKAALKDVDVVFHVAGSLIEKDWDGFYAANVKPVHLLLDAAVKVGGLKRFVLVSSTGAAGPSFDGAPLRETDPEHPVSAYGRSKLEGEKVAKAYFGRLPIAIVRPSAVYGPRDPNLLRVFKQVRGGITPLLGADEHYISLVHAEELADGIILAGERPEAIGQTFTLSSERPYTRTEILDTVGDVVGKRSLRPVLPKGPALAVAKAYANFITKVLKRQTLLDAERLETVGQRYWSFDVSKAMQQLGYRQKYPLMDGMRQTYQWYLERDWLNRDTGR
ncbi:MAG: NAD-dependent epimerase/dehydratase family protein [Myxococcota bacterium]